MTTVDNILLQIINSSEENFSEIKPRDLKVMKSLAKIILSPTFITENQGRLLLKILNENLEKFGEFSSEVKSIVLSPTWSKSFRPIDKTKKMYLSSDEPGIIIEFAFSSHLRKLITGIWKEISGLSQVNSGKIYRADLTEKNIIRLFETFEPHGFEVDEKIRNFYYTIKSWSKIEVENQFLLTNFSHGNFQKAITQDLGLETEIDQNVIHDRSIRYQYFVENFEKNPKNLTEKIAFRKSTKIWIDKKETTLDEIFSSLLKLKRLPTLVIFDHNDHKRCYEDLKNLHENLEKNGIFDGIGIYFRLPNDEHGTQFNKFIADHQYNSQLDNGTKIVGVQNGKIPKFFLKNAWKPMSVISIGNSLKQTKTAAYANCCDLIISYTESQPLIETGNLWL
jgi:hypothetical protein